MLSCKIIRGLRIQAATCFVLLAWPCFALAGPGSRQLRGLPLRHQSGSEGAISVVETQGIPLGKQHQRSLLQASPVMQGNGTSYILAAERTSRKDPLDNWKTYVRGWNIRDKHYWASVGSTATAAWIIALLWAFCGAVVILALGCSLCCRRHRPSHSSNPGHWTKVWFIPVIILTGLAIVGCGLLYNKTILWNRDMRRTLDVVVDEANNASATLKSVASELQTLSSSAAAGSILTQPQQDQLKQRVTEIEKAANDLQVKASDNSRKIRKALSYVRVTIIVVSALMLLLSLLGLVCLLLGFSNLVFTLVIIGWILIICTWILVGVGLILDNATQDTCVAMNDWSQHPAGGTTMDDILPCADLQVADRALLRVKEIVNIIVAYANNNVIKKFNNEANKAGGQIQPIGTVCSPYGPSPQYAPQSCPAGQINLTTAYVQLAKYVGLSPSLNQAQLDLLKSAIDSVDRLVGLTASLSSLTTCSNVRNAITRISVNYCSSLHSTLKGQWVGLLLISIACSILVGLWLFCAWERRKAEHHAPTGAILKQTHAPPPPLAVAPAPAVAQVAPALPRGIPSAPRSPRKEIPPPPTRSPKKFMGDPAPYEQLSPRPPQPAPSAPKMPGYYEHNV